MVCVIDLETYSSVSLRDSGLYAYVASPDFEILILSYDDDKGNTTTIDVKSGEQIPIEFLDMLRDPAITKAAHNAAFEIACFGKFLGEDYTVYADQWIDTMLLATYAGYPASLEGVGAALGLPVDKQKDMIGKALIKYFSVPCKPTQSNGGRIRNLPAHDPEKWQLYKDYNRQDVIAEREILTQLSVDSVPEWLLKQWVTDLKINARGVYVDTRFVNAAIAMRDQVNQSLFEEAVRISGLQNPNSISQLSAWLTEEIGETVNDLRKETIVDLLNAGVKSDAATRILEIRQELCKTSTKKYDAINACLCPDNRVHGLLQFYGARTGRWSGRLVQVQNLPRTYLNPELARQMVLDGRASLIRITYGSVTDTLSQLIRTAFTASPGNKLIDADFSAIEARVISWLAQEEWRLEVFRTHGKIYEASASKIFGVPMEKIKKGNPEYELRQRGKVAELALGYQGGVGAMRRMDVSHALDKESDEAIKVIVDQWRDTNPKIRDLWHNFEAAAKSAICGGVQEVNGIQFACADTTRGKKKLAMVLPSGRAMFYLDPKIETNQNGFECMTFVGQNQVTRKWERMETYGGKIVENAVQAIARDCLAEAIEKLEKAGFPIVFHVHDEVVIDTRPYADDGTMLQEVCRILSVPPKWAKDLPLKADGWVGDYFRKE